MTIDVTACRSCAPLREPNALRSIQKGEVHCRRPSPERPLWPGRSRPPSRSQAIWSTAAIASSARPSRPAVCSGLMSTSTKIRSSSSPKANSACGPGPRVDSDRRRDRLSSQGRAAHRMERYRRNGRDAGDYFAGRLRPILRRTRRNDRFGKLRKARTASPRISDFGGRRLGSRPQVPLRRAAMRTDTAELQKIGRV
jgi:hypothetical protein